MNGINVRINNVCNTNTGMPLTCHQKVGNYICLLLCPLSIYYYSAGSKEQTFKPKGKKPKPAREGRARTILIGSK